MLDQFTRTRLLLGDAGIERLSASRVAVIGTGLAAEFAAEALVRSGIGNIDIYGDADRDRLLDINPDIKLNIFYEGSLPEGKYDHIIKLAYSAENVPPHEIMKAGLIAAGNAVRKITRR